MRLSASGALAGWAASALVVWLWPTPVALGAVFTIAIAFTLLLAAHAVAFVMIARAKPRLGARDRGGCVPCRERKNRGEPRYATGRPPR